jgi:hypothetical protein
MPVPEIWIQYPGFSAECPEAIPLAIALAEGTLSAESAVSRGVFGQMLKSPLALGILANDYISRGGLLRDDVDVGQRAVHKANVRVFLLDGLASLLIANEERVFERGVGIVKGVERVASNVTLQVLLLAALLLEDASLDYYL